MDEELNLRRGERLLWSGKPERRHPFDREDAITVPLFAVWLGFMAALIKSSEADGAPVFFLQWAFLIMAVGLLQILGRYVVRFLQLGSTRYAVTDQRVIEIVGRPRRRRSEAYLRDLAPPVLRPVYAESIGSIAFGRFPKPWWSTRQRERDSGIVLRHVGEPRRVSDLIGEAQASVVRRAS